MSAFSLSRKGSEYKKLKDKSSAPTIFKKTNKHFLILLLFTFISLELNGFFAPTTATLLLQRSIRAHKECKNIFILKIASKYIVEKIASKWSRFYK